MEVIKVSVINESESMEFEVQVGEGPSATAHRVSMSEGQYKKLGAGAKSPSEFIRAAFRFLLDRESKQSIMSRFDITVISKYFPEFEDKIIEYF